MSLTVTADFAPVSHEIVEVMEALHARSPEISQRFATTLYAETAALCQRLGEGFRPLPDETASLYFSRPIFQLLIRTSAPKRRTHQGVWRVFYELRDRDGDGSPDLVRVLTIRSAAAPPLWEELP